MSSNGCALLWEDCGGSTGQGTLQRIQALLASVPAPDSEIEAQEIVLEGDVISPINPPKGCRFYTRCREYKKGCEENEPRLIEIEPGHFVACHAV